jgi:hypothetical protein
VTFQRLLREQPPSQLASIEEKLIRAEKHATELNDLIDSYVKSLPIKTRTVRDPARRTLSVLVETVAPVPPQISVVLGEIVHQLRSTLDHLVWQLVVWNTGKPPARPWKAAFPIAATEQQYDAQASAMLVGVSDCAVARVRGLQPFQPGGKPEVHYLTLLQELNNVDKHRTLHALTATSGVSKIVGDQPPTRISGPARDVVPAPGDELVRLEGVGDGNEQFFVCSIDVVVDQVGPVRQVPIGQLGRWLISRVDEAIATFTPDFS